LLLRKTLKYCPGLVDHYMSSGCAQGIKRLAQTFVREPIGEIRQIADVSMYRAITGRYPIKARGVQSIFTDGAAVEPSDKGREQRFGFIEHAFVGTHELDEEPNRLNMVSDC